MGKVLCVLLLAILIFSCATNGTTRRTNYIISHPELDETTKDAIKEGKIFIGMTDEQVIASWGHPDEVNRSVGSWGLEEQWVYERGKRRYLYFENGHLTSWQTFGN